MPGIIRRSAVATFVAFRLVRSRRSATLSVVTVLSIVGVMMGDCAMTCVLGVTNGFQGAFRERVLGLYPHIVVQSNPEFRDYSRIVDEIRTVPGVTGASPSTYDDMMLASGVHRAGSIIRGFELSSVRSVLPQLDDLVTRGSVDDLSETPSLTLTEGGSTIDIDGAVAGMWLTIAVLPDGSLISVTEDRTPPEHGNARLSVLDLRGVGDPLEVTFAPEGTADPIFPAAPTSIGSTVPGGFSAAVELRAGLWRARYSNELIALDADTLVTFVLLPAGADGTPRTRLLTAFVKQANPERTAMVRLVNGTAAQERVKIVHQSTDITPAAGPGEVTGYASVPGRLPGIILGVDLAKKLKADIGTEVTLVTPLRGIDNKMLGPYGMAPSSTHHVVVGIFESGYYDYDLRLALTNIDAVHRFMNRGPVIRWIEVRTADILALRQVKRRLKATLDPYDMRTMIRSTVEFRDRLRKVAEGAVDGLELRPPDGFLAGIENMHHVIQAVRGAVDLGYQPMFELVDWEEMNKNLFRALKLQKVVLTVFFIIMIIVGSCVVVGSQIMIIHDKTPDIAILKAMGATSGGVRTVFTLQGMFVATVGVVLGIGLGLGLCAIPSMIGIDLESAVYLLDELPIQFEATELILVAAGTLVSTLIATQYSAGRAARKTPVEGLRAVD